LLATAPAALRAFHRAHYRPDTTTVVVVGDVDDKALRALLEEQLGGWRAEGPRPATPTLAPPTPPSERRLVTVHVPGAPQTVLRVGADAPKDLLPYTADVEVMNTLLGGSFTSRLNNNLREKNGYAYGAGSRLLYVDAGNVFFVRTSVATAVTAPAVAEIVNELERIRTPATDEEVTRARNLAALSLPSVFDSGRGTAQFWASLLTQRVEAKRVQAFMADALKVDAAALQRAATRVVRPDRIIVTAVGDMDAVASSLSSYGARTSMTAAELLPGLPADSDGEE
jgi:zinc protease